MRCAKCSTSEHRRALQVAGVKRALRPRLRRNRSLVREAEVSFTKAPDLYIQVFRDAGNGSVLAFDGEKGAVELEN